MVKTKNGQHFLAVPKKHAIRGDHVPFPPNIRKKNERKYFEELLIERNFGDPVTFPPKIRKTNERKYDHGDNGDDATTTPGGDGDDATTAPGGDGDDATTAPGGDGDTTTTDGDGDDDDETTSSQSMEKCPMDVNTQDRKNEEVTEDVSSSMMCSELCSFRKDCTHWTFHHAKGPEELARKCITMTGFGHTNVDDNTTSGDRNCGG